MTGAESYLLDKMTCGTHGVHVMECFDRHHRPAPDKLHLPCGHLCDQPTRRRAMVVCDSGEHQWAMEHDDDKHVWNAVAVRANG